MFNFLKILFSKDKGTIEQALQKGAVVLDVRTPSEYMVGHIPGSKNIPVNEVRLKVEMIKKWNKPVITVCRSGSRSAMATSVLAAAGIEVYNGGAWTNLQQ